MNRRILFFLLATLPAAALEISELRRTEDWEAHLSRADALTKEHKYQEAGALFALLNTAADEHDYPLILKAKCRNNFGAMLHRGGRYREAETQYQLAAKYFLRAAGESSDEYATALNNLGEVYRQMAQFPQAEEAYRKSIAARESQSSRDRLRMAAVLNNLATTQLAAVQARLGPSGTGDPKARAADPALVEAANTFHRVLTIKREILGEKHPDVAVTLNNLAALRQDSGDTESAEKLYLEAVAIREAQSPQDHSALASLMNNLGTVHRNSGRMPTAETYFRRAAELWEQSLGPNHPTLAAGLANLAELLVNSGRGQEAEPMLRRAMTIYNDRLGPEHAQTISATETLGVLFLDQQKAAGAEVLFRRVYEARMKQFGAKHALTIVAQHQMARSLVLLGRYTEAGRALREELAAIAEGGLERTPLHGHALLETAFLHLLEGDLPAGESRMNELSLFAGTLGAEQQQSLGELYQASARMARDSKKRREADRLEGKARSFLPRQ